MGTYLAYGTHNTGWWGEGEVKFFIDGDGKFPTICRRIIGHRGFA